jgi:hypothetical protein
MSSVHTIKGKYHILDFPLSGDWVDKILGRIVLDKESPTGVTAPPNDGPHGSWIPQKILPEIAAERQPYNTLYYLLNNFKDVEQSAKLTTFFKEKAIKATSATHAITAIDVERIDMSNIEDKLEMLWANENWRKAAEKILVDNGQIQKLGMVTGIFVSKSLTVEVEDTKESGVSGSIKAPISEALGDVTGTLDVAVSAKHKQGNSKETEFDIEALSVFAIAYTDVTLRPLHPKTPPKRPSFFQRNKNSKKHHSDVEYQIYIDKSPGAKLFAGSSSSSDLDTESTTSTHVDAARIASTTNGEEQEARSTASTAVGEQLVTDSLPYVFKTPETVFGAS